MLKSNPTLQELVEFVKSGIPPNFLKAILLRVALKEDSPSTTIKAVEILMSLSDGGTSDNKTLDWQGLNLARDLARAVYGNDIDGAGVILGDIGRKLLNPQTGFSDSSIPTFITRVGAERDANLPAGSTQPSLDGRSDPGGEIDDSPTWDRDAATPW